MNGSNSNPDQTLIQPSTPNVACPSSTHTETKLSEALKTALILLEAFSHEILSSDKLELIFIRAENNRPEGISEEDYKELLLKLKKVCDKSRKSNIIAQMLF